MSELDAEGKKEFDRLRNKTETIIGDPNEGKEGKSWIKISIPTKGKVGGEWEVKCAEKVKNLEVLIYSGLKYDIPNKIWNRTGEKTVMGNLIFEFKKKDVSTIKGKWEDLENYHGKPRNQFPAGEYLIFVVARNMNADEQVRLRRIVKITE